MLAPAGALEAASPVPPPEAPAREFRAAWIATVANIDWPSRSGLDPAEQRRELGDLLDLAQRLGMNAVVLQVRPACDALYQSELEPWSSFLSGEQGVAPADGYDPLTWAVAAAHARGLELHAWLNPYRASHPSYDGPLATGHVSNQQPSLVRTYGSYGWLDPGEPAALEHSLAVVRDIVRRYDVDAIHFDDYFYPYPVSDALDGDPEGKKVEVPFPDNPSWERYRDATPKEDRLSRDDWRRENVNRMIRAVAEVVHEEKPHVRLGVSPFGIWRPGVPEGIRGFDQYAKLYADARLWLREGWVDYLAPQLYWPIEQKPQSFTKLLAWWATQNPRERHLWAGLYTSKLMFDPPAYERGEIVNQIVAAREQRGATGHIHFSMKAIAANSGGVADRLAEAYAEPALTPAAPWLAGDTPPPSPPRVVQNPAAVDRFALEADAEVARWVIQKRCGGAWTTAIAPGSVKTVTVRPDASGAPPTNLAVRAVDRFGRASEPTLVAFAGLGPTDEPTGEE